MQIRLWRRLARLTLAVYPRRWRARYADELLALLETSPVGPAVVLDLITGALRERGLPAAVWWTLRSTGRIAFAWAAALALVGALWVAFVFIYAPIGAARFDFDRDVWIAKRLRDLSWIVPSTSFYIVPSFVFALPGLGVLFALRAGRRPWLARAGTVASFLVFSAWWDRTLFFAYTGLPDPQFGHFAALFFSLFLGRALFPPSSKAAPADAVEHRAHSTDSSPRSLLRARLEPSR